MEHERIIMELSGASLALVQRHSLPSRRLKHRLVDRSVALFHFMNGAINPQLVCVAKPRGVIRTDHRSTPAVTVTHRSRWSRTSQTHFHACFFVAAVIWKLIWRVHRKIIHVCVRMSSHACSHTECPRLRFVYKIGRLAIATNREHLVFSCQAPNVTV